MGDFFCFNIDQIATVDSYEWWLSKDYLKI